jgi:penicillin amidase
VPLAGDSNTISQAGARPTKPTAFSHNIANLRMVVDLADVNASRFILCGGQSGNPLSPNYDDQFPLWQAGDTIPLPWDRNAIIRDAVQTLQLLPSS